jgi:hypothetical protein
MRACLWALLCAVAYMAPAQAAQSPVVLELFTSQGCSSCPPADALLEKRAADPSVVALSLHVHYWDYLGWKDPFASQAHTDRQRHYAKALGDSVYTPQLVVDGMRAVVGSDAGAVDAAIRAAQAQPHTAITLKREGAALVIALPETLLPAHASLWAMEYIPRANTQVQAGENGGQTLQSVNNVIRITPLALQPGTRQVKLDLPESGHGVAIVLQDDMQGRILGSAAYKG